MKKLFLSLVLVCVASIGLQAETNYLTLVGFTIEQSFALKSVKNISFTATDIIMTMTDGTQESFPLQNLNKVTFTNQPTAIEQIDHQSSTGRIRVEGTDVVCNGLGRLTIYNASGMPCMQQMTETGSNIVSLRSLPRGLYIIQMGEESVKVIR